MLERAQGVDPGNGQVSTTLHEVAQAQARARAEAEARAQAQARAREAEQARVRAEAERSGRIGLFPDQTLRSCYRPLGGRGEDAPRAATRARQRVERAFSHYARGSGATSLGAGRHLWQGNAVHKEPTVEAVRSAARAMGLDAVVMGWYHCHHSQNIDADTYRLYLYLVDVRTGAVHRSERPMMDTPQAVDAVLAALDAARGL